MPSPMPIFVLGLQRSGTTWIGNLLAAHDRVSAVTAESHRGIHESIFFSHFARVWDWSDAERRAAAIDAFLSSDYGRLAALDLQQQRQLHKAITPAEAFMYMMDCIATREGAVAWVEKSPHHVQHACEIARYYPDARFVLIRRDSVSLVVSRRRAYGRRPAGGFRNLFNSIRGAVANVYYGKLLARMRDRHLNRTVLLDYARFKQGGDRAIAGLLSDLGLPAQPGLSPAFAANSSHADPDSGRETLSVGHQMLIRFSEAAAAALPLPLLDGLRRTVADNNVTFPAWTWTDGPPADLSRARTISPVTINALSNPKAEEITCRD